MVSARRLESSLNLKAKFFVLITLLSSLLGPWSVSVHARTLTTNSDLEIMYSHRTCIVIRSKTPICLRLIRFSQVHLIVTCNWKWTDWLVPDHPKWVVCDFSKTWFSIYLKEKSRNCPCNNSKYFDFYYLALINHFFFIRNSYLHHMKTQNWLVSLYLSV